MTKFVGVKFKSTGKVYDFDCGAFVLKRGDHVIVQTEQGLGFGTVVNPPVSIDDQPHDKPLKKVHRLASEKDFIQIEQNLEDEKSAYAYCQKCVEQLELKMNLFSVEKSFEGGKYTFFFTAEGRIDFRQLVKMLVKELGSRVEMRQVGIRHQAKMSGGIGRCGRITCCSSYLDKFGPVSIRMAKEQNLSLNPTKISGLCNRLMCCLTYEFETYQELKKDFPQIGKKVNTPSGKGKILRHNVIGNQTTVRLDSGTEIDLNLDEITLEED